MSWPMPAPVNAPSTRMHTSGHTLRVARFARFGAAPTWRAARCFSAQACMGVSPVTSTAAAASFASAAVTAFTGFACFLLRAPCSAKGALQLLVAAALRPGG